MATGYVSTNHPLSEEIIIFETCISSPSDLTKLAYYATIAYDETWTGVIKHGVIKHGVIKHGVIKHGVIKHHPGVIKHGVIKHGVIKHGVIKRGVINYGITK